VIIGVVALLLAAVGFVVAELMVPAHGVLAILAGLCALGAVVVASLTNLYFGVLVGLAVIVAAPVIFFWMAKVYPQTPIGRRILLAPPATAAGPGEAPASVMVGDVGTTMTVLRPAGAVEIHGERVNCVSEAEVIAVGTEVQVIRVQGPRVVVKAVDRMIK
jgi:membrane-bound serine protease (ClpP class)